MPNYVFRADGSAHEREVPSWQRPAPVRPARKPSLLARIIKALFGA